MANILDLMGHVQQGFSDGKQRGQQTRLGQLAGQAYTAPQDQRSGILSQMAMIDPRAAQSQQQQFRTGDTDRVKQLSQKAKLFVGLAKAGDQQAIATLYPQIAQGAKEAFGIDVSPTYDPSFLAGIEQFATLGDADDSTPAGVREFNGLTQGLSADDVMAARRVKLGLDGRASSSGYSQVKFTGSDGRERIGVLNGQTGQIDMPDGTSFNPQTGVTAPTQGGGQGPQARNYGPSAGLPAVPGAPAEIQGIYQSLAQKHGFEITSMQRPVLAGLGAGVNSQHPKGTAVDYRTIGKTQAQIQALRADLEAQGFEVIDESNGKTGTGPHLHAELPPRGRSVGAGLGASRTPEEQAGLTTAAQESAKLGALPAELGMRANSAVDQAVRIEQGKTALEKATAAPAVIATMQTSLDSIDALLNDPDLGSIVGLGSMNPLNKVPGTKARGLIARAEQVAGQSFLAAFNQLKGGGAITEREGQAATAAMARLDRSQSEADYKAALRDLKAAIKPAIDRAKQQAGSASNGASGSVWTRDANGKLVRGN